MRALLTLTVLVTLTHGASAFAAPKVEMYGASWCGPCQLVKSTLNKNGVAYRYHDIDTPSGLAAYNVARGSVRSIPLTVVNGRRIVGADVDGILAALGKAGRVARKGRSGETLYGGQTAAWWAAQFRQLRDYQARVEAEIKKFPLLPFDQRDQKQVEALKAMRETVLASIRQLDTDASKVELPRKYRR